jgi:hypothetical protein
VRRFLLAATIAISVTVPIATIIALPPASAGTAFCAHATGRTSGANFFKLSRCSFVFKKEKALAGIGTDLIAGNNVTHVWTWHGDLRTTTVKVNVIAGGSTNCGSNWSPFTVTGVVIANTSLSAAVGQPVLLIVCHKDNGNIHPIKLAPGTQAKI